MAYFTPLLNALERTHATTPLATLVVTKLDDTNDAICNADCSLREAISAAAAGDTITFAAGLSGTITLGGTELLIEKNLTIQGPGAQVLSVSGNQLSRVFNVNNPSVVALSGLTVTGGNSIANGSNRGGGIRNLGTLTLSNMVVTGNTAGPVGGGGIINDGGTLTLNRVTISGNSTVSSAAGGGIRNTSFNNVNGNLIINDSFITDNTGGNFGGGIASNFILPTGNPAVITITNTVISGNRAASGGGILNGSGSTQLTITNSTISGNSATGSGGGGIFNSSGMATLNHVTISGNTATGSGGGLLNNGLGVLALTSCTITANSASNSTNRSDGLLNQAVTANVTIRNSIVCANGESGTFVDVAGPLTSQGYNLVGAVDAAAVFNAAGDQTGITNVRLTQLGNHGGPTPTHALGIDSPARDKGKNFNAAANDQRGRARTFDVPTLANAPGGDGTDIGAVEAGPVTTRTVTKLADTYDGICDADCSLRDAIGASEAGGMVAFAPGLAGTITLNGTQVILDNDLTIAGPGANLLTITANQASRVFLLPDPLFEGTNNGFRRFFGVNATITGLTISGGGETNQGGGIHMGRFNILTLRHVIVTGNTGGGLFGELSNSLLVSHSAITNNSGNGLSLNALNYAAISNSTISDNTSNSGGAGLRIQGGSQAFLTNTTITGNQTTQSGGGLNTSGITLLARNSLIAGNTANGVSQDIQGPINLQGYNLIGNTSGAIINGGGSNDLLNVNPLLGALANNGGPTPTHALLPGSPALDAGASAPLAELQLVRRCLSGNFTLSFNGQATGALNCNANLTEVQTALNALPAINGSATVFPLGSNNEGFLVVFGGTLAGINQPQLTATRTNGEAISVTTLQDGGLLANDQRGALRPFDNPTIPDAPDGNGSDIGALETQISDCATISVTPAMLPNGRASVSYSQQLTGVGGSAPYTLALNSGNLPGNVTLSSGGLLSGTPTSFGIFTFAILITSANGCTGSQNFTWTVSPPCSTITLGSLANGAVNTNYNQTITATGGTSPYTFAVTAGALPNGLALGSDGALNGTPTAPGTFDFTVTATDFMACMGTRAYSVVIGCTVSLAPSSRDFSAAAAISSVGVTATNCPWTAVSNAEWLTLTGATAGNGNASVPYSLTSNTGASRTGTISVNGVMHTVFQATADTTQDSDNDGIPDSVEITEGRNPLVKDNDIFSNVATGYRLFVMQQYRDFLGREGDPGGITNWVNALNANTLTPAQVIESFFNSAEFQNTGAPIVRLYFAYFLRIPDYTGLQNWTNAYRGGMSLDTISNAFAGSAEFIQTYGALDNTAFVTLVYNNVLGRAPDPTGLASWVNALNNGMTRGTMMLGFSESPEYKTRSGNWVYVTMMYVGMLRRSPEQAGFDNWVGYFNAGNSGLDLINGFIGAQEYRNRFLP